MTDKDNPLDDDLLRELGLEPRAPEVKPKPAQPPPSPPPRPAAKTPVPPPHAAAPKNPPAPPVSPPSVSTGLKNLAQDMPVQVLAVLGKRTLSIKDIVSMKEGEVLELKKDVSESIDLVANGKLVAKGDLVLVDGKVGIQIKQIV